MTLQNTFTENMSAGIEGDWYDISDTDAVGRSAEFSVVPFGSAVVLGTHDNQVRLPDHGGYLATVDPAKLATDPVINKFAGMAMYHASLPRCPGDGLSLPFHDGATVYLQETETVSVATMGRFYVIADSDHIMGDPVFFRHTLADNAAVPQTQRLGQLRNDDDGGNATQIVGAEFMNTGLAGELTIVKLTGAVQA